MSKDDFNFLYYPSWELDSFVATLRETSSDIGLCHGCFDLFHFGHAIHLTEARALSDFLIVSITADKQIDKGVDRPIFGERDRALVLQGMRAVDAVVVNKERTAEGIIQLIRPTRFFKGADYKGLHHEGLLKEQSAVEKNGGQLIYTEGDRYSSTRVLERIKGERV